MTLKKRLALPIVVMVVGLGAFASAQSMMAKKVKMFFVEPKNNATVTSPVHMKFGSGGASESGCSSR